MISKRHDFKSEIPYEQRCKAAIEQLRKYPDRVPIIVQPATFKVPDIERKKFLVPKTITVAIFLIEIKKYIHVGTHDGIFLFVNDQVVPPCTMMIDELYNRYKDQDGFLYITYAMENVFG
jgi:GABA(A) receptor-associated protein